MIRKEETGRLVEDVEGRVEGAEASAEDVKVKQKNTPRVAMLIISVFILFIVNIVRVD